MHMMRKDSPVYKSFANYFSTIFKDLKAWHLHKPTLNYAVKGKVKVLFDDRENSTKALRTHFIAKNYFAQYFKHLEWFKGEDIPESIIANCLDLLMTKRNGRIKPRR